MKTKLNIKSIKRLCNVLNTDQKNLYEILHTFEKSCRKKTIITKSGKIRNIIIASTPVKTIQKNILYLLYKVYIHDAAHGWRKGRSIKTNAQKHCGNPAKLCLDIKNCFPNTHSSTIRKLFEEHLGCSPLISRELTRLTTFDYMLPQGFSTSGALINILFRKMDLALSRIAKKYSLVFTRYGDDITFSGKYISHNIRKYIINKILSFGIILNNKKEEYTSGDFSPLITGLNTSGHHLKVPRSYKKRLRASLHRADHAKTDSERENILQRVRHQSLYIQNMES